MKSTPILTTAVLLTALCSGGSSGVTGKREMFSFHWENVIGTSLELKVLAFSETRAVEAESVVLKEIDREAKILSGYDASSEFSHWVGTKGQAMCTFRLNCSRFWTCSTSGATAPTALWTPPRKP